jgi:hypothetical protein
MCLTAIKTTTIAFLRLRSMVLDLEETTWPILISLSRQVTRPTENFSDLGRAMNCVRIVNSAHQLIKRIFSSFICYECQMHV